jgi:beta-phosphoglucomutase
MLRAVIFDFDGVIVDSEILHLRAFNKVLAQFGLELSKQDYYEQYLGFSDYDCFSRLIDDGLLKSGQSRINNLRSQKHKFFEQLAKSEARTIDGVKEFLDLLKNNNIPSAICSGALLNEIKLILEGAKLKDFFIEIVSAEQVKKGKPDPEGFLLTLKKLNSSRGDSIQAGQCVVIEDSTWGLQAAKAAGMHNVAVTNSYDAEQLSIAEKIITHLSELTIDDLQHLCA